MIAKIIVFHFTGQGRPPRLNREDLIGLRNSFQDALEVLQKVLVPRRLTPL